VRDTQDALDVKQMKHSTQELRNSMPNLNILEPMLNDGAEVKIQKAEHNDSAFHGSMIKREMEALHKQALSKLKLLKPLKVLKYEDEVMEKALEKAKQIKRQKKSKKRNDKPAKKA